MEPISNIANGTNGATPSRKIMVGGAQLGAIHRDTPRSEALARMLKLMDEAHAKGVKLLVYPEIAFTTFFTTTPDHG